MLLFIAIHGGLRIMMGQHARSESLFYYFRIEDQVPENHLLRLLDRHISFDFVREKLKDSYSDTGRPSIDPELLLRILLIGYLYGVTSERKLVEELQMHLAWRWFTGLSFDQEIPHHSTFSKNRHGRFLESNLFQQLFEEIVDRCQAAVITTYLRPRLLRGYRGSSICAAPKPSESSVAVGIPTQLPTVAAPEEIGRGVEFAV